MDRILAVDRVQWLIQNIPQILAVVDPEELAEMQENLQLQLAEGMKAVTMNDIVAGPIAVGVEQTNLNEVQPLNNPVPAPLPAMAPSETVDAAILLRLVDPIQLANLIVVEADLKALCQHASYALEKFLQAIHLAVQMIGALKRNHLTNACIPDALWSISRLNIHETVAQYFSDKSFDAHLKNWINSENATLLEILAKAVGNACLHQESAVNLHTSGIILRLFTLKPESLFAIANLALHQVLQFDVVVAYIPRLLERWDAELSGNGMMTGAHKLAADVLSRGFEEKRAKFWLYQESNCHQVLKLSCRQLLGVTTDITRLTLLNVINKCIIVARTSTVNYFRRFDQMKLLRGLQHEYIQTSDAAKTFIDLFTTSMRDASNTDSMEERVAFFFKQSGAPKALQASTETLTFPEDKTFSPHEPIKTR
ncbi:hypothetical protein HDU79_011778 [Rhizoclosmatium sp. JEL0117]|nr:hypothetical protein HDU79_011778 [Rhizoclosmatium sp. JEL0117]